MRVLFLIVIVVSVSCSVEFRHQKQAVMLTIENNSSGCVNVYPADSCWDVLVVDTGDNTRVTREFVDSVVKLGKMANFKKIRLLLKNEIINIAIDTVGIGDVE